MTDKNNRVQELLSDFDVSSPELTKIILSLRKLVLESSSDVEESVKYGGLVFIKKGQLIGGVFLRKSFVTMEFSFGNDLKDVDDLLEGTGKFRRNLKFRELVEIEAKRAKYFIEQAYA